MNDIGFGIFCFGDDYYYKGTVEKINKIIELGYKCYILTENPKFFNKKYNKKLVETILYNRIHKSYHDKIILPKFILKNHNISILLDADIHINNYTFLENLKTYKFNKGISYVDTLINHPSKKEFIGELDLTTSEWESYKEYVDYLEIDIENEPTIWEYFLIFNKDGFQQDNFYKIYERLQIAKEFCDLIVNKEVSGCGEGISLTIASKISETNLQRDLELYNIIKDKMVSVSRKFTRPEFLPNFMK